MRNFPEVRVTHSSSLPYKVEKIDISKNTQKEDWFLAINPNGRIPALTDKFTDGQTINLFESGSIMLYLVERYDTEYKISYPKGSRQWYEMNNWLFFQNAGLGPMQGQASRCLSISIYETDRLRKEALNGLSEGRNTLSEVVRLLQGSDSVTHPNHVFRCLEQMPRSSPPEWRCP